MDFKRRQPMGVELVKRNIVKEDDIENALQYQREHPNMKIGDILYELKQIVAIKKNNIKSTQYKTAIKLLQNV